MTQLANWPAPFPFQGLIDLIAKLAGVSAIRSHKDRPVLGLEGGDQAWIICHQTSSREMGVDEYRVQTNPNDPSGNTLQANVCGARVQTISLRCESLDDGPSTLSILERVRWGLRTQVGFNGLTALGIALADFETIQHVSGQTADNRDLECAVLDIHFNWAVNFTPLDDDGTTIGLVNGDTQAPGNPPTILGTVTDPSAPAAPDFDSVIGDDESLGTTQTVG